MLRTYAIVDTPTVQVARVACAAPRSPRGDEEQVSSPRFVIPRRGVFRLHGRHGELTLDGTIAIALAPGDTYRVSHPVDGGDECTVVAPAADVAEDALGGAAPSPLPLSPQAQLAARALRPGMGHLDAEEAALHLLDLLAATAPRPPARLAPFQRRRIDGLLAAMAADPGAPWTLGDLARSAGCSPFHLARQFRSATGRTIGRHLLSLRLALALERLAEGERDLARLAVDAGFAHHSHFSERFRLAVGESPSSARARLSKIATAELRRRP